MGRGGWSAALAVGAVVAVGSVSACGDASGPDAGIVGVGHQWGSWDRELDGPGPEMRFGAGLSVGPDADGDGLGDLLVGAPSSENPGFGPGRVFLYSGRSGELLRSWTGEGATDLFGACVSLGPDVDGDGLADVLVGAPDAGAWAGKAYLYSGKTGALLHEWVGEDTGRLGARCALGADVDGDGRGDIALSEPSVSYDEILVGDVWVSRTGRVYVFSGGPLEPLWILEAPERGLSNFGDILSLGWPVADGYREEILVGIEGILGDPARASLISTRTGAELHTWTGEGGYFVTARLGPDATGDGVPDVATVWGNEVQLWSGADAGRVASLPFPDADYISAAFGPDATGDGLGDLLVVQWSRPGGAAGVRAQLYDGASRELVNDWSTGTGGIAVAAMGPDMDGDGVGDFAVADYLVGEPVRPRVGKVWVFLSARSSR